MPWDGAKVVLRVHLSTMPSLLVKMLAFAFLVNTSVVGGATSRQAPSTTGTLDSCPGYVAKNIETTPSSLTADLALAGTPCNVFGQDIVALKLSVVYEDGNFRINIPRRH